MSTWDDKPNDYEHALAEIEGLRDAIWEYGSHRKNCRIDSGKECDCGFFEIIKSFLVEQQGNKP
jgi:hypothetical protein